MKPTLTAKILYFIVLTGFFQLSWSYSNFTDNSKTNHFNNISHIIEIHGTPKELSSVYQKMQGIGLYNIDYSQKGRYEFIQEFSYFNNELKSEYKCELEKNLTFPIIFNSVIRKSDCLLEDGSIDAICLLERFPPHKNSCNFKGLSKYIFHHKKNDKNHEKNKNPKDQGKGGSIQPNTTTKNDTKHNQSCLLEKYSDSISCLFEYMNKQDITYKHSSITPNSKGHTTFQNKEQIQYSGSILLLFFGDTNSPQDKFKEGFFSLIIKLFYIISGIFILIIFLSVLTHLYYWLVKSIENIMN